MLKMSSFSVTGSERNKNIPHSYNNPIVCYTIIYFFCMHFVFYTTILFPQKAQYLTFEQQNIKLHFEGSGSICSSLVKYKVLLFYLTNSIVLTLSICKYLFYLKMLEFYKMRNRNRYFKVTFMISPSFFFLRFYLFTFRERGREGEREGEKHQCVVASHMAPAGDLAPTQACGALTGNQTGNPLVHSLHPVL